MTTDEMIAVLQAVKDGRPIQMRRLNSDLGRDQPWEDCGTPTIIAAANFAYYEFRVKPELPKPREIWVNKFEGKFLSSHGSYYMTREIALIEGAGFFAGRVTPVLFREVIDES